MTFLLDTNALIWSALSAEKLSIAAARVIVDSRNLLLVSAASAWEISTKVRVGKFPEAKVLESRFMELEEQMGLQFVAVEVSDGLMAGRLSGVHRDPFDRMIAAQALRLNVPVISSDEVLDSFGVRRVW